jgi:hypothetical protein
VRGRDRIGHEELLSGQDGGLAFALPGQRDPLRPQEIRGLEQRQREDPAAVGDAGQPAPLLLLAAAALDRRTGQDRAQQGRRQQRAPGLLQQSSPSQPSSAISFQSSAEYPSAVSEMRRTSVIGHLSSRNLRTSARSSSCSSVNPKFMFSSASDGQRAHSPPRMRSLEAASIAARAIRLARVPEIIYNHARARLFEGIASTCSDVLSPSLRSKGR